MYQLYPDVLQMSFGSVIAGLDFGYVFCMSCTSVEKILKLLSSSSSLLFWLSLEKRSLGILRRWEDNIKMNLREISCDCWWWNWLRIVSIGRPWCWRRCTFGLYYKSTTSLWYCCCCYDHHNHNQTSFSPLPVSEWRNLNFFFFCLTMYCAQAVLYEYLLLCWHFSTCFEFLCYLWSVLGKQTLKNFSAYFYHRLKDGANACQKCFVSVNTR
jgi:hypothetical protein